jgi:hypothetical protein
MHSVSVGWHVVRQLPPEQTLPAAQTFPQAPQLALSLWVRAQKVEPPSVVQVANPWPHDAAQAPPEQSWPVGQACPQLPQLAGSDMMLAQASIVPSIGTSDVASFTASPVASTGRGSASIYAPSIEPSKLGPASVVSIADEQPEIPHWMTARHAILSAKRRPHFWMPIMIPPVVPAPSRDARARARLNQILEGVVKCNLSPSYFRQHLNIRRRGFVCIRT